MSVVREDLPGAPRRSIDPDQNGVLQAFAFRPIRKLRSINEPAAIARTLMCDAARKACDGQAGGA